MNRSVPGCDEASFNLDAVVGGACVESSMEKKRRRWRSEREGGEHSWRSEAMNDGTRMERNALILGCRVAAAAVVMDRCDMMALHVRGKLPKSC